jgi:hypothetical protein
MAVEFLAALEWPAVFPKNGIDNRYSNVYTCFKYVNLLSRHNSLASDHVTGTNRGRDMNKYWKQNRWPGSSNPMPAALQFHPLPTGAPSKGYPRVFRDKPRQTATNRDTKMDICFPFIFEFDLLRIEVSSVFAERCKFVQSGRRASPGPVPVFIFPVARGRVARPPVTDFQRRFRVQGGTSLSPRRAWLRAFAHALRGLRDVPPELGHHPAIPALADWLEFGVTRHIVRELKDRISASLFLSDGQL